MLLTVMQAGPPVPRKIPDDPAQRAAQVKSNGTTSQAPPDQADTKDQYDPRADNLYRWYLRFTVIGVIGGSIGIGVLVWQAILTRESAHAAKDAAAAASNNAKALMNAERPWVVPKIVRTVKSVPNFPEAGGEQTYRNVTYFSFWIRNVGRTPAQIMVVRGDPQITYKGIDGGFTDPPDYGLPTVFKHIRLLAPGEKWRTDDDLNIWPLFNLDGTIENDIKTHKVHYIFKGVVLYNDTFDPTTIHETRFCYTYLELTDDWHNSGPPDHTKYT